MVCTQKIFFYGIKEIYNGRARLKKIKGENTQVSLDGTNVNFYKLAGVFAGLIILKIKSKDYCKQICIWKKKNYT